jgi:hypothetical protein
MSASLDYIYFVIEAMKNKIQFFIMVLSIGLFILPKSAFAHSQGPISIPTECSSIHMSSSDNDCCVTHVSKDSKDKNDMDCNGSCISSGCFSSHAFSYLNPVVVQESDDNFTISIHNEWNYSKQQPKPVYFQIWSPPKIG